MAQATETSCTSGIPPSESNLKTAKSWVGLTLTAKELASSLPGRCSAFWRCALPYRGIGQEHMVSNDVDSSNFEIVRCYGMPARFQHSLAGTLRELPALELYS